MSVLQRFSHTSPF